MRLPALLLLALLPLAACSAREDHDDDDDGFEFDATDWSTQLSSRAGTSVAGSASARSVGLGGGAGTSTASVTLSDAMPGARHPWHVHAGTCSNSGGVIGSTGDYPLLVVAADGRARADAAIGAGMSDGERYHVNVHRSTEDMTVIACGDLVD